LALIPVCISFFEFVQIDSSAQIAASTPSQEAALRAVVESYYAACGNKDLAGVLALWSEKSPNLAAYRQSLERQFASEDLSYGGLVVSRVKVENEKAKLRATIATTSINLKSQQKSERRLMLSFEFVKEGGAWKVWRSASAAEDLAEALVNAAGKTERTALLAEDTELVTAELGQALLMRSYQLFTQGRFNLAKEINELNLEISERCGVKTLMVQALVAIARAYWSQGDYDQSLEYLQKSLKIAEDIGGKGGIASILNNIANIQLARGDYAQALEKLQRSLKLAEEIGDKEYISAILNNIASVLDSRGDYAQALEQYQRSLKISEEIGDKVIIAAALTNIARVQTSRGEYAQALEQFQRGLKHVEEAGDKGHIADILNNIGIIYDLQADYTRALELYQRSLKLKEEIGDKAGIANTLQNIGVIHHKQSDYARGLEYYQKSLAMKEAIGDKEGVASSLNNIANIQIARGEYAQALERLQQSLKLREEIGDKAGVASSLYNIGEAYRLSGETRQAREPYDRALRIARELGVRPEEAAVLLGIERVEKGQGNLTLARDAIEKAIGIIESVRANITGQERRASYFGARREYYESYIDLLMEQHRQNPSAGIDAEAFAVSERARARSLLELLTESHADIREGVEPALLERERSLQQRLNARAAAQVDLLNSNHTPAQAEAAAKEIDSLTNEYEEIRAQIRKSSPRYAALTQPQSLNLAEIQQQTLDPDTLLLEYSLGDYASYLFVVSQTSITSYQLPKRSEIEAMTRRAHELLTAPQPRPGETEAKRQARIKEAGASYWPQAAALSQMLLGPAASQLGSKRLLIVADGALQYLPFGALPVPGQAISTSPRFEFATTPLVVEHEIVHLPSASALAALRRERAGRQPGSKAVAVLADPVFSATDARVKPGGKTLAGEERPSDLTRAVNDVRGDLARLLMTRDEAEAILSVTPRNGGLAALDFRANRATATSDELSDYRIVHFATHGLLDSEHPELSGLALSLVDEQGRSQDGFLRLHEIFNLRLPVELVVLSACQTGLGKEVKGEGLVGLTRGFMYAGASRVVASLWQVNDAATAELMKRFYRRMLQDGMRPAAALRAAQIEMWKKPQWQSPFYWSGFALQGEWK
jgi:CHAT domain-containing protein